MSDFTSRLPLQSGAMIAVTLEWGLIATTVIAVLIVSIV